MYKVMVYQKTGKRHIRYINQMAKDIYQESDFEMEWKVCLELAFERHRRWLKQCEISKTQG